jgi:branched-chain amino acid transport system ATP-binding protein
MLEVENLEVSYGALMALHGVSLTIQPQEVVAVVGPNGAGKSTLLKAIAGLLRSRRGTIRWAGHRIDGQPPEHVLERGIALVPEGRRLFARMTVRENLELGAFTQPAQKGRQAQLERVYSIFPRLSEREHQMAGLLSGGEQQMLAVARALMGHPTLLILDEPSLGLAPRFVESLFSVLAELKRDGMSFMIVDQNVHMALQLAQRAYILEGGRIVREGEAQRMLHDDHVRAAYLGPLARGTS